MNSNKKALLVCASFALIFVIVACSCGSLSRAGGSQPAGPAKPANPDSSQATNVPAAPAATSPATEPVVSLGPAALEQVSTQVSLPAGQSGSSTATCPAGTQMLGGGFASGAGIKITKSMPDPSGWLVAGVNTSTDALELTSYAACLHNAIGTIRIVSAQIPVSGAPFARCQKGEIITGGGYAFDTNSLEVYISTPIGDSVDPNNAWSVMARSSQNADEPITVYAVCLSGSGLTSKLVRDDMVAYDSGANNLSFNLTCPNGFQMVSGGYEGTGVFINRVNATVASVWDVQVQGKIYFDGSLDHAVCLKLE